MWMLYGASGYTGRLTAELACQRGLRPILAGRNAEKVRQLAQRLGLEYRVFALEQAEVRKNLGGVAAVLHMAGPFAATSRVMVDACLETGSHYLDITGEFSVFEAIFARHEEAVRAGVVLLPGVGFDVVPTDCLAAMLHEALPDATELELAFAALGAKPSPGTTKTWVEVLGNKGLAREGGQVVQVPLGHRSCQVPFPSGSVQCLAVPLGDLSSAYVTTRIPNIIVYVGMPSGALRAVKVLGSLRPLFKKSAVQRALKRVLDLVVSGPDASRRGLARTEVWGSVSNTAGKRVSGALTTPDGYTLTTDAALLALERVLTGKVAPGATTPAKAFGSGFVAQCEGVVVYPTQVGHTKRS